VSFSDIVVTGPVRNADGSTVSFELLFYTDTFQAGNLSGAGSNGANSQVDYSFNNTSGFAKTAAGEPVIPANDTTFTVESWFRVDSTKTWQDGYATIVAQDQDVGGCTSNRLFISIIPHTGNSSSIHTAQGVCGDVYATGMVQDDVWNHIAYVSDGTQTRIYLNGALVATINTSGLNVTSARAGFMIGASGTNGSIHQFPGRIDQVKVWNRALNATEVSA
jgi:hypothetical protein